MSSDTRDLSPRTAQVKPPDRVQLSIVQVAASALASISAAVVASIFGVAGTVVGAGLVAVLSTTGSAIYSASMKRTSSQLRRARESLLTARASDSRGRSSGTAVLEAPTRSTRAGDTGNGGSIGAFFRRFRSDSSDSDSSDSEESKSRWRRGWLTVGS